MGYIGVITHFLTFNPNFQRDIQAGGVNRSVGNGGPEEWRDVRGTSGQRGES